MRRLFLAALLTLAAGCSKSPCQELGEKICGCQVGMNKDSCKTQVENQLKDLDPSEDFCRQRLDGTAEVGPCSEPGGVSFCEWLLTEDGKVRCGLTPQTPPP